MRYKELLLMVREWRYLKMLKRSGCTHVKDGNTSIPTSFAILCPACPQPGINLPEGWENAPDETGLVCFMYNFRADYYGSWLYTQILALDANFRMSRKAISSKGRDPSLTNGYGYFVDNAAFEAHLEARKGERQEVHFLYKKTHNF